MDELKKVERKLTKKDYFVVSSMLFALFFGAGNLIFPLHLGQLAGHNWFIATLGFLITGVVLPLLSIMAIALTRSEGVYDIALPLGAGFAVTFMALIHATIGPFFGTPRTATVSFTVGIAPFVGKGNEQLALLIYSALFFGTACWISYNEKDILNRLGKVLNPIFLLLLFLVFLVAMINPLGSASAGHATSAYSNTGSAFLNGFLEGYNTMDALAGLAFGITVVTAIKQLGKKEDRSVAVVTARSGILGMGAVAVIYFFLILIGAMSLGKFTLSADGGVAFSQIVQHYAGSVGQAILATLMTITCLTTAVGLVAAFGQDFHKHFPRFSYRFWLFMSSFASFLIANVGLNEIIAWSTPFLMFLYPLSMVLIVLSVMAPIINKDSTVYFFTVLFTVPPALLDFINALPDIARNQAWAQALLKVRSILPLSDVGMSWLLPALIGLMIGLVLFFVKKKQVSKQA